MDALSYSYADKQAKRIKRFIEDPDSTSGIVTVPKTIASGETVTVPAGRVAVLPNIVVDGTLNIDGEVFIPSGSSVDFSNGIKIDGNNIVLSIPTAYHIYNGSVEATNTVVTNGFSTTLYTGNGGTQSVNTGVDMSTQWGNDASEMFGGLSWIKSRSLANGHQLYDTVRGATKVIRSQLDIEENTEVAGLTSFNNSGFNVGSLAGVNQNASTYASWNFQTTHRRTGVTNHGKAYTEHYNPFTGFTIIKYEGSGIAGHEIPHSLGRKLSLITMKTLSAASDFPVYLFDINNYMYLNATIAGGGVQTNTCDSSKVTITTGYNASTNQHIIYGWANSYYDADNTLIGNYEIGVYQGTGVAGNKVTTRGKPAWVMIKRLDSTGNWNIYNNQVTDGSLIANLSNAESTYDATDFVSDGFILKSVVYSEHNISGGQFLYMVVYDNDSGSGKSKYPKATDATNLSINALVPYANGIDVNGEKVSISYKNETITGLTLTQGQNYPYSKNDGTYGVNKYLPMYGKLRDRVVAGENPDYFDLETRKWYGTSGGNELVTNGTFDSATTGWTAYLGATITYVNGVMQVVRAGDGYSGAQQTIQTEVGKKYKLVADVTKGNDNWGQIGVFSGVPSSSNTLGTIRSGINNYVYFTAQSSTTLLSTQSDTTGSYIYVDNISVFETTPTIGAEITPRTYLDCVVYADHNGQVEYVEELPKIEYVDIIKANEYQGKNACIALLRAYTGTTPIIIRESYNINSVVRLSAGVYDVYLAEEVDIYKVIVSGSTSFIGAAVTPDLSSSTNNKIRIICYRSDHLGNFSGADGEISIQIFGGKN